MENIKMDFRARREDLGLTLDEVATLVGVNNSTISRWERGDIHNMKRQYIVKYARALQISPAVIMGWDAASGSGLTENEKNVLHALRSIDQETRDAFISRIMLYYEAFENLEKLKKETKGGD